MAVTHVLFDFFGTLVGYSPSRTEQGYERSHALLREAGCALGYDACLALWSDVSEAMDAEAERTLAVVTNTHDAELVPRHLERMGVLEHFARVVTSVEFGVRKPAPAIFAHAVRELGTGPERCVYVGDTYGADYRGATGAGLRAFLIDPGAAAPVPEEHRLASLLAFEERTHAL